MVEDVATGIHRSNPYRRTPPWYRAALVSAAILSAAFGPGDDVVAQQPSCVPAPAAKCQRSNFIGKSFRGENLAGIDFADASLNAADFTETNLEGANFRDARLVHTRLRRANLRGADFTGADVTLADFGGANSDGATIWPAGFDPRQRLCSYYGSYADLRGDDLTLHAPVSKWPLSLKWAILRGAKMDSLAWKGVDLQGADLRGASLRETDLRQADLSQTILLDADMRGAKLKGATLADAVCNDNTLLPKNTLEVTQNLSPSCAQAAKLAKKLK